MARGLATLINTEVQAANLRPILLARIDTSGGEIYVWTGVGDLVFDSNTYKGVGDFGSISEVLETDDLQANGITLTLSGISASNISLALSEIKQGKEATIYLAFLDSSLALIVDPYEIFTGETDIPIINHGADTTTVGIQCENRMVTLNKARVRRYTPEDQKIDDATDKGFDFVAALQDVAFEFGQKREASAIASIEAQ